MDTPESTSSRASKRRCLRRDKEIGVCTPQNESSPRSFFPCSFPSPVSRSTATPHRTSSTARASSSNAECAMIADRSEATQKTATPPDKGTFPSAPRHAADDADMAKQQFTFMQSLRDTNKGSHALINALQEATDLALQTGGRQAELVALAQSALEVMKNGNPGRSEKATAPSTHFASGPSPSSLLQRDSVLELLRQRRSVCAGSESRQAVSTHPEDEGEKPDDISIRRGQIIEGIDLLRLRGETLQGNWTPTPEGITHYDNILKARYLEGLKSSAQLREANPPLPTNPRDAQRFRAAVQNANSCRPLSPEKTSVRMHATPGGNDNSATPTPFQSAAGTPHQRADPSLAAFAPLLYSPPGVLPGGFRVEAPRPAPLASSSDVILQTLRALMSFTTTPATAPPVSCNFSTPTAQSEKDLSVSSAESLSALLCANNPPNIIPTSSATGTGTTRPESISEFRKAQLSAPAFAGVMQPAAQNLLYSLLMSCGTDHPRQILAEREAISTNTTSARTPGRDIRQYSALPNPQDVFASQSHTRPATQSSTPTPPRVLSPPSGAGLGDYGSLSSPPQHRPGSCIETQSFGQSQHEYPKDMQSVGRSSSTCNISDLLAKKSYSVELCHSSEDAAAQMTPTHSNYSSIRRRGSRLIAEKDASPAADLRDSSATGDVTGVQRGRSRTESLTGGDSMSRTGSVARSESTSRTGSTRRGRGRYAAVAGEGTLVPSSTGRGIDSTAGGGVTGGNQDNETGKPDVTLGGNRPHYHVAKQEWRVRYYLNGKRKMRTYSAKFYGYEAAHSMATDFAQYVDKNEALPHPVCKPVGIGGGRSAAYSSMMAGRALSAAAVARERDEQPDLSVGARYTTSRQQQLTEQQPPPLHPQERTSAAATTAKGLEAQRLSCAAAGNAASFPPQPTNGAGSATGTAAATRVAAGEVDSFSLDEESSPAVARMCGLSRSSTRVLQTSATPSEDESSPYYEHSLSTKVEVNRERSSSCCQTHDVREESSLQRGYSSTAAQQKTTPSSLSAFDFASDTTLANFLKSRKRRSSAVCYVEGRPSAPAPLPGNTAPGGLAAVAEADGGNDDGALKSMRLNVASCISPAGTAMIQNTTESAEGKTATTYEGTTDNTAGAEALFEGLHEREKLYLSKLFSSVWLPPACSQPSSEIAAAPDRRDNSGRYANKLAGLPPPKLDEFASAGAAVQEGCAQLQKRGTESSSLLSNVSRSAFADSSNSTHPLSIRKSASYNLLQEVPATQHKTPSCSHLAAALLQGQACELPLQAVGLPGEEATQERWTWMTQIHGNSSSNNSSSVRRVCRGWKDLTASGGSAQAGTAVVGSPTAEEVAVPATPSRTETITGTLGREREKLISMAPGHVTAAMLAKTAVSQQMIDTVTLFDEFVRGFEKEFSAEQVQQQRRALLRPAACFAPEMCASLSALEPPVPDAGDCAKTCKHCGPACGMRLTPSCRPMKEDTSMLLPRSLSDCLSTLNDTNDFACLSGAGCPAVGAIPKEQELTMQTNKSLRNSSPGCSPVPTGGSSNRTGFRLQLRSSELLVLSRVLVELTSSTYVLVTTLKSTLASSTDIVQKHCAKLPVASTEATRNVSNNSLKDAAGCQKTEEIESLYPKRRAHEAWTELKPDASASAVAHDGTNVVLHQHSTEKKQQQENHLVGVKSEKEDVAISSGASMVDGEQNLSPESSNKRAKPTTDLSAAVPKPLENSAETNTTASTAQHPTLSMGQTSAPKDSAFEASKGSEGTEVRREEGQDSRQQLGCDSPHGELPSEEAPEETHGSLTTFTEPLLSSLELGGNIGEQDAESVDLAACGEMAECPVEQPPRKCSPEDEKASGTAQNGVHQRNLASPSQHLQGRIANDKQQPPRESEGRERQQRERENSKEPEGTSAREPVAEQRYQKRACQKFALGEGMANDHEMGITQQGVQDGEQRQQTSTHQHELRRQQWKTQAQRPPVSAGRSCTCTNSGIVLHNILTLLQSQRRLVSVVTHLQMSLPQYLRLIIRVAGPCFLPYRLPPATYFVNNSRTGSAGGSVPDAAFGACAPTAGSVISSGGTTGAPVTPSVLTGERHLQLSWQSSVKGPSGCTHDQTEASVMRRRGSISMERDAGENRRISVGSEEKEVREKEEIAREVDQQNDEGMTCLKLSERLPSFSSFSKQSSSVIGFAACGAATSASSTEAEYNADSSTLLNGEIERKFSTETVEEETVPSRTCEDSSGRGHSRTEVGGREQWECPERELAQSPAKGESVKAATIREGGATTGIATKGTPGTDNFKDARSGSGARTTTAASASGFAAGSKCSRVQPFIEVPGGRIIQDEAALEVFLLRPFQPVVCSCQERPCPCDRQHIADLIRMLYTLPRPCKDTGSTTLPTPSSASPATDEASPSNTEAADIAGQSRDSSVRRPSAAFTSTATVGDFAQLDAAKLDFEECSAGDANEAAAAAALSFKELPGAIADLSHCDQRQQEESLSSTSDSTCLSGDRGAQPVNSISSGSSSSKVCFRSHGGIASSRTTSSGSSSSSSEPTTIGTDALMLVEESLKQMLAENVIEKSNDHTSCNHPTVHSVSGSPLCSSQTTGTPHTMLSGAGTPGNALSSASSPFQRNLSAASISASCLLREAVRQSTPHTHGEEKKAGYRGGEGTGDITTTPKLKEDEQAGQEGLSWPSGGSRATRETTAGSSAAPGCTGFAPFSFSPSSSSGSLIKTTSLSESRTGVAAEVDLQTGTISPHSRGREDFEKLEERDVTSSDSRSNLDSSAIQTTHVSKDGTCNSSTSIEATPDKEFSPPGDHSRRRGEAAAVEQTATSPNQDAEPERTTASTAAIERDEKAEIRINGGEEGAQRKRKGSAEDTTSVREGKADSILSASSSEWKTEAASTAAAAAKTAAESLGTIISARATTISEGLTLFREDERLHEGQSTVATERGAHDNVAIAASMEAEEPLSSPHITAAVTGGESSKVITSARHRNATSEETGEEMKLLTVGNDWREQFHKNQLDALAAPRATTCSWEACRCVDEDLQRFDETKRDNIRSLNSLGDRRCQEEENRDQNSLCEGEELVRGRAKELAGSEFGGARRGFSARRPVSEDGEKEGRDVLGEGAALGTRLERIKRSCSMLQEGPSPSLVQEKSATALDLSYPTMLASILPLQSLAHTIARLIVHLHRQLICRYIAAHVNMLVDNPISHSKVNIAPAVLQRLVRQLTDGNIKCSNLSTSSSSLSGGNNNTSATATNRSGNNSCCNTYSRSSSSSSTAKESQSNSNGRRSQEVASIPPHSNGHGAAAEASECMSQSGDLGRGRSIEEEFAAATKIFARSAAACTSRMVDSCEDERKKLTKRSAAALLGDSVADAAARLQHLLEKRGAEMSRIFCPSEKLKETNGPAAGEAAGEAGRIGCLDSTSMCFAPQSEANASGDRPADLGSSSGLMPYRFQPRSNVTPLAAARINRTDSSWSSNKDSEELESTGTTTRLAVSCADIVRAAVAAVGTSSEATTAGPQAELLSLSRGCGDVSPAATASPAVVQKSSFPVSPMTSVDNKFPLSFPLCTNEAPPNKQGFLHLSSADILERVAALTRSSAAGRTDSAREFPPVEEGTQKISDSKAAEISQLLARAQAFYASHDTGEKSATAVAHSRTQETQENIVSDSPHEDSASPLLALLTSAETSSSSLRSCLY